MAGGMEGTVVERCGVSPASDDVSMFVAEARSFSSPRPGLLRLRLPLALSRRHLSYPITADNDAIDTLDLNQTDLRPSIELESPRCVPPRASAQAVAPRNPASTSHPNALSRDDRLTPACTIQFYARDVTDTFGTIDTSAPGAT